MTGNTTLLDAALDVFLRYGFKRTTMGDIAKAAGLSRQSLYARFANKDEVYAAGLELYIGRMIDTLNAEWAKTDDLGEAMDIFANTSLIPSFEMLRLHPDASDMIEGAETPEGKAAMASVMVRKLAILTELFDRHGAALSAKGLSAAQLADFVETSKQALMNTATDRAHLDAQFAILKASVLSLCDAD